MDDVSDELKKAIRSLRSADHSIYATLKYTRSRDVLKNVLKKIAATFTHSIDAVLVKAHEENIVLDIPADLKSRENEFRRLFPDMEEFMDRYTFLRKVIRIEDFTCVEEFRKNITLVLELEGTEHRINAEDVNSYYAQAKEFLSEVTQIVEKDILKPQEDE